MSNRPDSGSPSTLSADRKLALFQAVFDENREAPPSLSAWDKAFLRGLYGTDSGSVTQRAEIAGRVLRDVRQAETPPR